MMEYTLWVKAAREEALTMTLRVVTVEMANDPRPISQLPIRVEMSVPYEQRDQYRLGARVRIQVEPVVPVGE